MSAWTYIKFKNPVLPVVDRKNRLPPGTQAVGFEGRPFVAVLFSSASEEPLAVAGRFFCKWKGQPAEFVSLEGKRYPAAGEVYAWKPAPKRARWKYEDAR